MSRQRSLNAAEDCDQDVAISVAQSLQKDFIGLITIFDRQLSTGSDADFEVWSKISDAKAAAQRGLILSQELAALLHKNR